MRVKKVAVSLAAVIRRCRYTCAAQNHLVYHKFAVVFADRARWFREIRIRQICAVRPFPAQAPIEFVRRRFPFKFGRKPRAFPFSKRGGFVKRNVADRVFGFYFAQAA